MEIIITNISLLSPPLGEMYPDHVGIPMGEEHGGATYFMLEIHYNNPNLRSG